MVLPKIELKPYELLDLIHNRFVEPLSEARATCAALDTSYFDHFLTFKAWMYSLIDGPDPASIGKTADALRLRIQDYERAQRAIMGNGALSQRMEDIFAACETAARDVQDLINIFPPAIPPFPFVPIWTDYLVISRGLGGDNASYFVTYPQLALLELMGDIRVVWTLALESMVDENADPNMRVPDLLEANDFVKEIITLPPVSLDPQQQKDLYSIQLLLTLLGITIPSETIAALLGRGFLPKDIINAIILWHERDRTDAQITDLLFVAAFNQSLASYYNGGLPYGFDSPAQYQDFSNTLLVGLQTALNTKDEHYCVGANVGGSAVTGLSYKRGQPFDQGRASDYDITLTDPRLLAKAAAHGIKTYDDGLRTGPLSDQELMDLGLFNLERQLTAKAGRPVHFILYASAVDDYSRAPYITFFPNSCSSSPS